MHIENQYEVEFTDECKKEIKRIYNYIRDNLLEENAANRLMEKIEEYTSNLSFAPRMYAEIDKYKNTRRIYRRIVINNYVLLYTIDEEKRKVFISNMYYGGSDYINNI